MSENHNTAEYIASHRDRHDRMLSADPGHYISSKGAFINEMLNGLPSNAYTHPLFERYDYMRDEDKNNEEASRLAAAILRLLHTPKRRNPGTTDNRLISSPCTGHGKLT